MIRLLEEHREEIARLCREYQVLRLEVFGSAADDMFNPSTSDLDFLAEFLRVHDMAADDQYFGLLEHLTALLGRRVDLVEAGAMRNPYFIKRVNEGRRAVNAA